MLNLRELVTCCSRTWTPSTRRASAGTRRSISGNRCKPWRPRPNNSIPQVLTHLGYARPYVTAPLLTSVVPADSAPGALGPLQSLVDSLATLAYNQPWHLA